MKFLYFFLLVFFCSNAKAIESEYIRGVSDDQWQVINHIGDHLNCEERIAKIKNIQAGNVITAQDFIENPSVINKSLIDNDITILEQGKYELRNSIRVGKDKTLIGRGEVFLLGKETATAIFNSGSISNLTILNAQEYGVEIYKNSDTYKVVIRNTGVNAPNNPQGIGVHSSGTNSFGNCVVSVEAMNGYNEKGSSSVEKKGGNADGFTVKYGAHNITLIDTYAHHNSDDGYDFWKGGAGADIEQNKPTIRIFYSSANHNGKNPLTPNGDGNGFKFGSWDGYQKDLGKDKGARLIYGSAACFNAAKGFDRNRTSTKIIAKNLNARGNAESYKNVPNFNRTPDPHSLKCDTLPRK